MCELVSASFRIQPVCPVGYSHIFSRSRHGRYRFHRVFGDSEYRSPIICNIISCLTLIISVIYPVLVLFFKLDIIEKETVIACHKDIGHIICGMKRRNEPANFPHSLRTSLCGLRRIVMSDGIYGIVEYIDQRILEKLTLLILSQFRKLSIVYA